MITLEQVKSEMDINGWVAFVKSYVGDYATYESVFHELARVFPEERQAFTQDRFCLWALNVTYEASFKCQFQELLNG